MLFGQPGAFADKWRQAVRFYEVDLGSRFVCVLIELYAARLSNPELRAAFKPRMVAWYQVLRQVAAEAITAYGLEDVITPEVAAAGIGHFWMEMEMLCGIGDGNTHIGGHWRRLRRCCGGWIEGGQWEPRGRRRRHSTLVTFVEETRSQQARRAADPRPDCQTIDRSQCCDAGNQGLWARNPCAKISSNLAASDR